MARDLSRAGLERWFDELMSREGRSLERLAASYTRTAGDREDLCQEIATAIWGALPRFRGECSERTFVFRIAHNRALAHVTRRPVSAAPIEDVDLCDPGPNPEAALARGEESERLLDAIRELPLGYRQVMTLTLEGLGYSDIAEVIGISESNVGARLTRARQLLRRRFRDVPRRSAERGGGS